MGNPQRPTASLEKGYRKVIIESDSKAGMGLIEVAEETSPYHNIVQQIRMLKKKGVIMQL